MESDDLGGRQVTVTSAQRYLIGTFMAGFPLVLACAPVGTGLVRAAWVMLFLGVSTFVFVRAVRMKVVASGSRVVVQNLGRSYAVPWSDIVAVDAASSDNVTGRVTTIYVRRQRESDVVARVASSYSSAKVERWRDEILSVRP